MRLHNNVLLVSLAASLTLSLTACGDDKGTTDSDGTTSTTNPGTDASTGSTGSTTSEPVTTGTTSSEPSTSEPATGSTTGEPTGETTSEPTTGLTTTGGGSTSGTTDEDTTTGLEGPSFAADVYPVLDPPKLCDCHNPGSGGLKMGDVDTAYDNLVGVMSTEAPLKRVEPGDTMQSYLWHKISGTHLDVGGSGKAMPLGAPALPQETLDLIQEWIDAGAQP